MGYSGTHQSQLIGSISAYSYSHLCIILSHLLLFPSPANNPHNDDGDQYNCSNDYPGNSSPGHPTCTLIPIVWCLCAFGITEVKKVQNLLNSRKTTATQRAIPCSVATCHAARIGSKRTGSKKVASSHPARTRAWKFHKTATKSNYIRVVVGTLWRYVVKGPSCQVRTCIASGPIYGARRRITAELNFVLCLDACDAQNEADNSG